ncbi:Uu.00g098710.m01.CDS01 [Anthostomella pinea]|uniref:Uu.00g098710.m01.CDS01 n=1 Tax=Anthostomella pinea TaxID=933095 RepID=A0AAI8VD69_9PEZI|nr:Uu.00g098710.m01.CDS01 [Anthostomella pinea]
MLAGPVDTVHFMEAGEARDELQQSNHGLHSIIGYNTIVGAGTGGAICVVGPFLNHSCNPNAYLYWNELLEVMTLHALTPIACREGITIDYLDDQSTYPTADQRNATLKEN